jgi:hypothetical protein
VRSGCSDVEVGALSLCALLLLGCLAACASGPASARLASLYEPGAARAEGALRTARQQNELAFTRLRDPRTGELDLVEEAASALGVDLSSAVGFDAYRARVRIGRGYSATWRRYCDSVFFDEEERIVGAYRREGSCRASYAR